MKAISMARHIYLFTLALSMLCLHITHANTANSTKTHSLQGYYMTHIGASGRQSIVEFFSRNGKFYAYGFANVDGSGPKKDINNPNPALRERIDKGTVFVYGLKPSGNDFSGGEVYNYDDGKTYHLKITQSANGTLTLRASVDKLGMLGQTFTWTPLTPQQIQQYEKEKPSPQVVEASYQSLPQAFK